jgi:hypothetical protein
MELTAVGLSVRIDTDGLMKLSVVPPSPTWSNHLPYNGAIWRDFNKLVTG